MDPVETVDVMAWRAELSRGLEDYDRYAESNPDTVTAAVMKFDRAVSFKIHGDNLPVYYQRYRPPVPAAL